jgi:hypothetical protein
VKTYRKCADPRDSVVFKPDFNTHNTSIPDRVPLFKMFKKPHQYLNKHTMVQYQRFVAIRLGYCPLFRYEETRLVAAFQSHSAESDQPRDRQRMVHLNNFPLSFKATIELFEEKVADQVIQDCKGKASWLEFVCFALLVFYLFICVYFIYLYACIMTNLFVSINLV